MRLITWETTSKWPKSRPDRERTKNQFVEAEGNQEPEVLGLGWKSHSNKDLEIQRKL